VFGPLEAVANPSKYLGGLTSTAKERWLAEFRKSGDSIDSFKEKYPQAYEKAKAEGYLDGLTQEPMPAKKAKKQEAKAKKELKAVRRGERRDTIVSAPVASAVTRTVGVPRTTTKGDKTRVKFREYVRDVPLGAAASLKRRTEPGTVSEFEVDAVAHINPGNSELFPYLHEIAEAFEEYEFLGLAFELLTMAPTSSQGAMYLGVDYDAADAPPMDKREMLNMKGAARGPVWANTVRCEVDPKYLGPKGTLAKFVRQAAIPADTDIKTYDVGTLFVGSDDLATDTTAELWVEYDMELKIPQMSDAVPGYGYEAGMVIGGVLSNALQLITALDNGQVGELLGGQERISGDCDFEMGQNQNYFRANCTGTFVAFFEYDISGTGLSGPVIPQISVSGDAEVTDSWNNGMAMALASTHLRGTAIQTFRINGLVDADGEPTKVFWNVPGLATYTTIGQIDVYFSICRAPFPLLPGDALARPRYKHIHDRYSHVLPKGADKPVKATVPDAIMVIGVDGGSVKRGRQPRENSTAGGGWGGPARG